MCRAGWRIDHPGSGSRVDELFGQRADSDTNDRVDAAHIEQRWLFLLALNVFLLLVGTVMDIFSAIVVVVPLILPLADAYRITYVHLGVIFIANLELGISIRRSASTCCSRTRFKKPVLEVTLGNAADAWFCNQGAAHHLRPWLTEGLLRWMGRL